MAFQNFPYSDFHELNLDWVVKVVKDCLESIEVNNKTVAEMVEYVKNYFNNLDVSEEIAAKLDEMESNGSLAEIITQSVLEKAAYTESADSAAERISVTVERYNDTTIYITKIKKDGCTVNLIPANGSVTAPGEKMGTVYGAAQRVLSNDLSGVQVVCSSGYGKIYGFSDGTFYENASYMFADRANEYYAWFGNDGGIKTAQVTQAQNTVTYLQSLGAVKNVIPALFCLYIKDGVPTTYPAAEDVGDKIELAPRQILAEDDNYYYIFTSLGRMLGQRGIGVVDMRNYLATKNLKTAVNLDGGGVVQTIVGGLPICPVMDFYTADLSYPGRKTISAITFSFE